MLPGLSVEAQRAVDTDPAEIVRRWIANLSDGARRKYRQAAREFCRWSMHQEGAAPEDALRVLVQAGPGAGHQLLVGFRDHLLNDRNLSTGTVAGMITGLCSLIGACRQAGITTWRPETVSPKVEKRVDRSGPQRFEIEQIVQHVDAQAAQGDVQAIRDSAILRLLYVAALRRSEVTGLRVQDVDLAAVDGPVVHPRRKGRREREPVLIGKRAGQAIAAWIEVRGTEPGPLFTRCDRARDRDVLVGLSGEALRRLVAARARQAGLQRVVRPHGLRHSSATEVARRAACRSSWPWGRGRRCPRPRDTLDERNEERIQAIGLVEL